MAEAKSPAQNSLVPKPSVLSVPAPDSSSQVGQSLGLGMRGQATEPQVWLCEGKSLTGKEEGQGGRQERGIRVSWAPQGSIHYGPHIIILFIRTLGPVSLS